MENYTWVFFGITALSAAATFFLVYSTSKKAEGKWEGSVETRLNKLEEAVKDIKKNIKDILDVLVKRGSPVAGGKSPLTLTSLGKEIAEEVSAREWAQNLAGALIKEVVEVIGKHSYEIEEFCFQYMREEPLLSEEINQKIKKAAYEKGITKRDVLDVLALELRDELIARLHK